MNTFSKRSSFMALNSHFSLQNNSNGQLSVRAYFSISRPLVFIGHHNSLRNNDHFPMLSYSSTSLADPIKECEWMTTEQVLVPCVTCLAARCTHFFSSKTDSECFFSFFSHRQPIGIHGFGEYPLYSTDILLRKARPYPFYGPLLVKNNEHFLRVCVSPIRVLSLFFPSGRHFSLPLFPFSPSNWKWMRFRLSSRLPRPLRPLYKKAWAGWILALRFE